MSTEVLVAVIASGPPTLAAVLSYAASKRSLRRSLGENSGTPLHDVILRVGERFDTRLDRFESKLDRVREDQAAIRERLVRLESGAPSGGHSG